mgnify:CR=1 FL=1
MGRRRRLGLGGAVVIYVYIAAFVILVVATWLLRSRRPESGMTSYRKHIDALSPESRRNVREVNERRQNGKRREN